MNHETAKVESLYKPLLKTDPLYDEVICQMTAGRIITPGFRHEDAVSDVENAIKGVYQVTDMLDRYVVHTGGQQYVVDNFYIHVVNTTPNELVNTHLSMLLKQLPTTNYIPWNVFNAPNEYRLSFSDTAAETEMWWLLTEPVPMVNKSRTLTIHYRSYRLQLLLTTNVGERWVIEDWALETKAGQPITIHPDDYPEPETPKGLIF